MTKPAKNLAVSPMALESVRSELKGDITKLRLEMKSGFKSVNAQFIEVDARLNKIDAQFERIDTHFYKFGAELASLNAKTDRMLTLYEEQNINNRASYRAAEDSKKEYGALEKRVEKLEDFQFSILTKTDTKK